MPNASREFETARTRQFRAAGLNKENDRTICLIEEFGCSVIQVKKTEYGLGWSYTVGAYDTAGKPKIITFGLPEKTALFALNDATSGCDPASISRRVGIATSLEMSNASFGWLIQNG